MPLAILLETFEGILVLELADSYRRLQAASWAVWAGISFHHFREVFLIIMNLGLGRGLGSPLWES